jgi:hypothetical protein
MLHGTVSLQDTRGQWVEVGTAARTVVRGTSIERLHLLARIYAQTEPYRLEIRTIEEPEAPPFSVQFGLQLDAGWVPPATPPRRRPIPVFIGD